jgi:hypothetical protein
MLNRLIARADNGFKRGFSALKFTPVAKATAEAKVLIAALESAAPPKSKANPCCD